MVSIFRFSKLSNVIVNVSPYPTPPPQQLHQLHVHVRRWSGPQRSIEISSTFVNFVQINAKSAYFLHPGTWREEK